MILNLMIQISQQQNLFFDFSVSDCLLKKGFYFSGEILSEMIFYKYKNFYLLSASFFWVVLYL